MSAHIRITALVCAASACLALVTGCTSDGAKPSAAGATTTGATASTTEGAPQESSGDAGCDEVLDAIGTLQANAADLADPTSAVKAYSGLSTTMLDAAAKATKPGAKAAIVKLSNDFTAFATQLAGGAKAPDTTAITTDTGAMATACS